MLTFVIDCVSSVLHFKICINTDCRFLMLTGNEVFTVCHAMQKQRVSGEINFSTPLWLIGSLGSIIKNNVHILDGRIFKKNPVFNGKRQIIISVKEETVNFLL